MKKETLPHKTSVELRIERTSFCRSLRAEDDSDWETIKNLLGYLGYEVKFIHMTLDPQVESAHAPNIINFGMPKMEPHGQARGPIQPPLWGDIPVKRWRIPPPAQHRGGSRAAGMDFQQGGVQRTVRSSSPSMAKTKVTQLFPRTSWRVRPKGCR